MSELNNNILDIQQQFKKNLLNKMKLQNQRYLKSLKIIETLIKENEDLKLTKSLEVSKKTKKKQRSPSKSVFIKNNDITQNIEILNMFKKIDTTLNNIIESSEFNDKKFDLMSVDVEGHELDVFIGFDLKKYAPNVIVVEFLDLSLSKIEIKNQNIHNIINSEIYKFLTSHDYTLANVVYADLIFINNNFKN